MEVGQSLILAVAALLGNAFFVGAEFAFISVRRSSIELAAAEGSRAARTCLAAMDNVTLTIATIQLGVTLCSLIFGAVAEPVVAHLVEPLLEYFRLSHNLLHSVSLVIALIAMVSVHVVIGEMVPKNISLAGPTRLALRLVPALYTIVRLIRPVVLLLNGMAVLSLRAIGLRPRQEVKSSYNRDEVAGFVQESRRVGLISKDEENRLTGSLEFEYHTIKDIVVPLRKLVVVDKKALLSDIEDASRATNFSRFPVSAESGELLGYVHIKDILMDSTVSNQKPLPIRDIRPLGSVKESITLMQALSEMRKSESHMLQVTRNSKTIGVIMLEDVLEELVGPITRAL